MPESQGGPSPFSFRVKNHRFRFARPEPVTNGLNLMGYMRMSLQSVVCQIRVFP